MTRSFRLVIIGAFLLKGLVSPFFGHGDLWVIHDVARGVGHSDWNVYRGVEENLTEPSAHPPSFVAAYGPMAYYPLYGYHSVLDLLGFENARECDAACELEDATLAWGLIAKLPYLAVDGAVVLALLRLLPTPWNRRAALGWAVSPALFFVTYLEGQVDLVTSGTIVVALALLVRSRSSISTNRVAPTENLERHQRRDDMLAMALLGLGTSIKVIPIFFGLAWIACTASRPKEAIRNVSVMIGVVGLTSLPFLGTPYFVRNFLLSDRGGDLFSADIQNLSPFFLLAVLPVVVVRQSRLVNTTEGLLVTSLSIGGALSLFTNFSPQRGVYIVVAIIMIASFTGQKMLAPLVAAAIVLLFPLVSTAMAGELLVHVSPMLAHVDPIQSLSRDPQAEHAITVVARSTALAAALWVLLPLLRGRRVADPDNSLRIALGGLAVPFALLAVTLVPVTRGATGPPASGDRYRAEQALPVVQQEFEGAYDDLEQIVVTLDPEGKNVGEGLVLRVYDTCAAAKPLRAVRADHLALFTGRAEEVAFSFPAIAEARGRRFCFTIDLSGFPAEIAPTVLRAHNKALTVPDPQTNDVVLFKDRYALSLRQAGEAVGDAIADEWLTFALSLIAGGAAGTWVAGMRPRNPLRRPKTRVSGRGADITP